MSRRDHHELLRQNTTDTAPLSSIPSSRDPVNTKPTGTRKFVGRKNVMCDSQWIERKNIQCRKCVRFVPTKTDKGGKEKVICGCGYHKSDHSLAFLSPPDVPPSEWNQKYDTETVPTDSFGEIEFVGYGQRRAKYIRVDVETSADVMWELMTRVWGLTPPNLVISVTGGAKNFHMTPRLKDVFRKGLVKAAISTEAWITSSGTNAGVMKYVGEAVRDLVMGQALQARVVALGIAPWGCVQNKQALVQKGGTAPYRISDERVSGETHLDSNHSHFILVDNGTQHKFAVEIPFRAKLEKTISERSASRAADRDKVPIILVVVEGGPGTLQTVYRSIQERTPAVIIGGSGRAANILAYAIQNCYEHVFEESRQQGEKILNKVLVMNSHVEEEMKKMLSEEFNESSEKRLNQWIEWVKRCLQFPDLLSVYQLDSDQSAKDIDLVMLQALLKANHEQVMEQLKLALIWDRVDIAKSEIFAEDRNFKAGSLDDIMFSAIVLNRVHFVKLFLENGVCLRDFLTVESLLRLYQAAPRKSILYEHLKKGRKNKSRDKISLHQVGHLIQSLMGDFYKSIYLSSPDEELPDPDFVDSSKTVLERPERDLFVWCVLMHRCEMARIFWEEGRDALAAALVANSLLKSIRQRTADNELKQDLLQDALEFQELAIGILRECYMDDAERAMKLLIRPLNYWGKTNCVSIAIEASNKEFIAQSACQELFSAIWWGKMDTENGLKILSCVVCPALVPICLRFKHDRVVEQKDEQERADTTIRNHKRSPQWASWNQSSVTSQGSTSSADLAEVIHVPSSLQKIKHFFQAPVTKFCYTVGFYLVFLMLYSYVMLIDLQWRISATEVVLMFWVFTMAVDEIRQLWKSSPGSVGERTANYLCDKWNILDVVTIGLFILGMILRLFPHHETFTAARVILAINLFTFFLRLLHIFSVSKLMGPKLVMIGRMLKDLVTFMLIMLVFIVGYAITSQSILYPNTDMNKMLVIDVLKKAYWQIFAELFLEEIEGKEDCVENMAAYTNGTHVRCPSEAGKVIVPILLAFYMLYMHILMLSLLIAVFTNTFEAVQSNTDLHWHFQRYKLVYEYYERPSLPPPFIVFSHIYQMIRFCMKGCTTNVMYGFLSDSDDNDQVDTLSLELFEENRRDEFMWERNQATMRSTEYRVAATANSVETLVSKVDDIREHLAFVDIFGVSGGDVTKFGLSTKPPNVRTLSQNVTRLESQVREMQSSLDWLIKALCDQNVVTGQALPQQVPSITMNADEKEADADGGTMLEGGRAVYFRQTTSVDTADLVTLKSRLSPYPGTNISRAEVPDNHAAWEDPFSSYNPVNFTSDIVRQNPLWADGEIDGSTNYSWNGFDEDIGVNRVSYQGEYVVDERGHPLNPIGRTGLQGRGCLGRWGPNHAADPIVTRWKCDERGEVVKREGKPVLEFVAVRRHDNKHWALPGGFLYSGESVDQAVRRRFVEEAMAGEDDTDDLGLQTLPDLLSQGTEIYRGYVDDERNTDNAWIETVAINYHDEDGSLTRNLKLRAGKTEDAVAWLPVWSKIPMQSNHCFILERVAELKDAAL